MNLIHSKLYLLFLLPSFLFAQQSFKDSRDGKVYELIKLGDLNWMTQNLTFELDGSVAIEKNNGIRFYRFERLNEVCPNGWRLPTMDDWEAFTNSFKEAKLARMMEDNEKLYRVDFLDKYNIFNDNVLNIKPFGRVEGGELNTGNFIDYWTRNSTTNDERFHMHLTPYSIVGHAHKHHLKSSKTDEFRLFPVRCVCEKLPKKE